MPRVRFTVRGMMTAVAVTAVCLWCGRTWRISAGHRETAQRFALAVPFFGREGPGPETPEEQAEDEKRIEELLKAKKEFYSAMQRKYERAARHPWLPVAPDPPEPN